MIDMAVIVPTRGRPQNVARLIDAWVSTGATSSLWLGYDDDDETFDVTDVNAHIAESQADVQISVMPRSNMNGTLNAIAKRAAYEYRFIGFMGDDHCPQTDGWDKAIIDALSAHSPSIAYANDLFQRANLPTQVFMTSDIVRALGYMAPPKLHHLYLDNSWLAWGRGIGHLHYLDDVVVEHLHYQAGKSEVDEGYERVNGGEMWEHDRAVFEDYEQHGLRRDVATLMGI